MSNTDPIYLSGDALYGDDFTQEQIEEWFRDEQEGYANLGAKKRDTYQYSYHKLNERHGYRHISNSRFDEVLGLGSAYGDEFLPIAQMISKLTIIDPSDAFSIIDNVHGVPCKYVKPDTSGDIAFPDNSFDLITCLGVLHHIPNVTHVINECHRCLTHGGTMLLREPIVSMGDWAHPRHGLTKRERGIPLHIFTKIIEEAGFTIQKKSLCVFPPISKLCNKIGVSAYNSAVLTLADSVLSNLFRWNLRYHATSVLHKFRPSSVYFVLTKN